MKDTFTLVAGLLIVFGAFIATNVQSQDRPSRPQTLSQEMKRFDLNNDGQLSADESAISIEVIALETFSDTQLSKSQIRQMYGAQPDGFDRRGRASRGRGGFRGFDSGSGDA